MELFACLFLPPALSSLQWQFPSLFCMGTFSRQELSFSLISGDHSKVGLSSPLYVFKGQSPGKNRQLLPHLYLPLYFLKTPCPCPFAFWQQEEKGRRRKKTLLTSAHHISGFLSLRPPHHPPSLPPLPLPPFHSLVVVEVEEGGGGRKGIFVHTFFFSSLPCSMSLLIIYVSTNAIPCYHIYYAIICMLCLCLMPLYVYLCI